MRVILVGPARERERLRSELDGKVIQIVGEFRSIAEARRSASGAAAVVMTADTVASHDVDRLAEIGDDEATLAEPLTPREMQVLGLLAEGLPNKAIADELGISDQTVKFHVASISGKLGAANRTDAVRRAVRRGLIAL
jgi:DNA-binding NarL/FixJ family response regulator